MDTITRSLMLVISFATARVLSSVCDVSNPCGVGSTCVTSATSPGYTCRCYAGFMLETQTCIDRDECALVSHLCHNGTCVNTPGSFQCKCNSGYSGSRCMQTSNPCDSSPCLNNAKCRQTSSGSGYFCTCYAGFIPPNCNDRDECSVVYNLCHNGTCVNTPGSFKCICDQGYSGSHCTDYDPCASSPCVNGACKPGNSGTDYTCKCYAGFVPPHCTDRDECSVVHNLCHNGTCVNTPGSFHCNCNPGYSGSHCTVQTQSPPATVSTLKVDTITPTSSSSSTSTPTSSSSSSATSSSSSSSTSTPTSSSTSTTTSSSSATLTSTSLSSSLSSSTSTPSSSATLSLTSSSSATSSSTSTPTSSSSATSISSAISPSSRTAQITERRSTTVTPTHPCNSSPCLNGGTCTQTANSFKCSCPPGFATPICSDLNECYLVPNLCHNGTCANTMGSFKCNCNIGYIGIHCTIQVKSTSTTATTIKGDTSTSLSSATSPNTITSQRSRGRIDDYVDVAVNVSTNKKGWASSNWWVFAIAGVVVCAVAATVVVVIVRRRRAMAVGIYNKFNSTTYAGSTPTSPTPIQQENPLYMAIHDVQSGNQDYPASSATQQDDSAIYSYVTINGVGNNVSEI